MTTKIGVVVCDCEGGISDHLDTGRVAAAGSALDGVVFVERTPLLCAEGSLEAAVTQLKRRRADRLLIAACSPRSSLKFPEERLAALLTHHGLSPELLEVANIREQCAWQHADPDAATAKAIDLLRMAHARLCLDQAAPPATDIPRRALVVGGGPAGLQAAKDLAAADLPVTLVERGRWLGGQLCQLHRVFQSEGWPSICDSVCVGPVQAKGALLDAGIDVLAQAEVTAVERIDGAFQVTVRQAPRFVDPDRCTSCGSCAEVCPEVTPRTFDGGRTTRAAIDKEFERGLPDCYDIVEAACTRCGDCVPACPTGAIDLDVTPVSTTQRFGAVLLAPGTEGIDLSGYDEYLGQHPDVVTALDFEQLLDGGLTRPSNGEAPESVVFVQCAGSRAGPDKQSDGVAYCSKTCCAVTAKQVDRLMAADPMAEATVVYYRDLRTYERALEELAQRLQMQGVEFVNGEVTAIAPDDRGALRLSVDPTAPGDGEAPGPVSLPADLVVLAAAQTPQRSAPLYDLFGVRTDRYGFPVEGQPRLFRPTESLVDRVYVLGSAAGPKVVQQAAEQGSAAAMRAFPVLHRGRVETSRYASRIALDRCTGCRTCEAVCPHGAIRMTDGGAVSDPAFCQACGFCAAACPVHAAELCNHTDAQLIAQARVAFDSVPDGEPRLLALLCYWCAYSAADFAGIKRAETPVNHRTLRVRCSSSVNTGLLLHLFQLGIDGILVAGCPERSCHHLHGNYIADKRVELARSLIGQLGLEQGRLRFEYIGAPMYEKLNEVLQQMDAKLRRLGPNPAAVWTTGIRARARPGAQAEG